METSVPPRSVPQFKDNPKFQVLVSGSRLVVTGCLAERYRDELQKEIDALAGFLTGGPVAQQEVQRLFLAGREVHVHLPERERIALAPPLGIADPEPRERARARERSTALRCLALRRRGPRQLG